MAALRRNALSRSRISERERTGSAVARSKRAVCDLSAVAHQLRVQVALVSKAGMLCLGCKGTQAVSVDQMVVRGVERARCKHGKGEGA